MRGLLLAIEFLTVVPMRRCGLLRRAMEHGELRMAAALPWFPVVSGAFGAILAGLDALAANSLAVGVRDALILGGMALGTGMLHLDGFVDCCDGLLGRRTVARRLEILRDSRVGAYGALGAALLLLTQFAALGAISPAWRAYALILAPALGRGGIVYAVVRYPYGRPSGLGMGYDGRWYHLVLSTVATLAIAAAALAILPGAWPARLTIAAIALGVGLVAMFTWGAWASHQLGGGLTGDVYGAMNEIVMTAVWIALSRP